MIRLANERRPFDPVDAALLAALDRDARQPVSALARLVGMSPPAVSERLRRLEADGVLKGFSVELDPAALGYALRALARIRPLPGKLHVVERLIEQCPHVVECLKVTGDDAFLAQLVVRSVDQLDTVLSSLADHAMTSTAIVKGHAVRRRLPPLE
ncbi:Lrp/AsnC family transcriptional regulator [Ancylobacter lacus]|uniref:Lrp/AsnC family transcriptional regulator n=1 Tax=Ancylobacter lacus TaxID=2579970 RepID=UPI001BCED62E|nr:Lrp/AsnC family transcriptional regulator [Ancylobacter lacus]MBS7540963.1 Lrp/AsnC family transcriptional regulator [Ancylobacter lacus]